MRYKLFDITILDTEDNISIGNFIVFIGAVGIAILIIIGLFHISWIIGCIGICCCIMALGGFIAGL